MQFSDSATGYQAEEEADHGIGQHYHFAGASAACEGIAYTTGNFEQSSFEETYAGAFFGERGGSSSSSLGHHDCLSEADYETADHSNTWVF